jgi:neurocalcin delta
MFPSLSQKDCPSGELSRRKFLAIYQTLFPDGKAGAFYEHVFRTFDEDGSGRIDFKEFLQVPYLLH